MAAIDFPTPTADGQLFGAPNGIVYRWLQAAGLWVNYGTGNNTAIINSTPPSNPVAGQLWWSPDLGQMFIWYVDPTSSQWVPTSPSPQSSVPAVDFFAAYTGVNGGWPTSLSPFAFNAVLSGNSGGWYNPSSGAFRPPAGRYYLYANIAAYQGGTGTPTGSVALRKNGANITVNSATAVGTTGWWVPVPVSATVDANGTDAFDVALITNLAGLQYQANLAWFGGFAVRGAS